MKLKLIGALLLCVTMNAHAAFIATTNGKINPNQPARIIVAGAPEDLGALFVHSSLTKAKLFQEANSEDQVIIVGRNDDLDTVTAAGYKAVESERGQLKQGTIGRAISLVKQVKSLDVFAHSNAASGIIIDKNAWTVQFLEEVDPIWDAMKAKSKDDSYVMFHGCNAGVKLGPWVAQRMGLAVLAALTGTDFQFIYNDSFWTQEHNNKKENLSATSALFSEKASSCKRGYCTRMKPDNSSYKGHWGDWTEGGYPSYKVFCGSNTNKKCAAGAVAAIKTYPSVVPVKQITTLEKFKEVAQDFLCPYGHDEAKQTQCKEALEDSLTATEKSTYSPFRGVTLNCDFTKCFAHFECGGLKASVNPGSCKLRNEKPGKNSTFTNEYKFLVDSYLATQPK